MESKSLKRVGDNFLSSGDFDKAVQFTLQAIDLSLTLNDPTLTSHNYSGLAEMYRLWDQYKLAITYNELALQYAKISGEEDAIAKAYNNLSAVLGEIGRNKDAIDSLQKGLTFLRSDNYFAIAKLNSNIGFCYRNMGEFQKAIDYQRIALKYKREAKMLSSLGYTFGSIGRAYLGLNMYDSAIYYVAKEVNEAKKYKNIHNIKDTYVHYGEVFEQMGKIDSAYHYLNLSLNLKDSIYRVEVETQTLLYQRKYDLSKKENEIARLKGEQLLNKATQKNTIIILLSLLVFSVLLLVLYRYRSSKNEQKRKVIELKLKAKEVEEVRNKEELKSFTKDLVAKNKAIRDLNEQLALKENQISEFRNSKTQELKELNDIRILTDEDWKRFKLLFEKVYPGFFNRLNAIELNFSKGEKRLLALTRLDVDNQQIADALGISAESVSKSKSRLKKKMSKTQYQSVEELANSI